MTETIPQGPAEIRLTQYSRGAGCGCKIAPSVLQQILQTSVTVPTDKNLLVGNSSSDDAAVYDLQNGQALITTTDFFMPIVDEAAAFGAIAAANAISDVYAMGGRPIVAIAVLGWPIEKLPVQLAQDVLESARRVCAEAGIILAGGHSIDSAEPIFGLAVNGLVDLAHLKQNNTAGEGDVLFLTKPIGVGILSTAQKRGLIKPEEEELMITQMKVLNKIGEQLGKIPGVTAMTDVTGFGLMGHLIEMAEGTGLSVNLEYSKIPVIAAAKEYLAQRVVPDATFRNWNSYSAKVGFEKGVNVMEAFSLLPDPQTNGGLLFSVKKDNVNEVKNLLISNGLAEFSEPIGEFSIKAAKTVNVLL